MNGYHTFIYFSADCRAVSSLQLVSQASADLPSTEWLLDMLKELEPTMLVNLAQEPVGLILKIIRRLLGYQIFSVVIIFVALSIPLVSVAPGMSSLIEFIVTWMKS